MEDVLQEKLRERFPKAEITVDPPAEPNGAWFLDARRGENAVVVEWRPRMGFGISTPGGVYGRGRTNLRPMLNRPWFVCLNFWSYPQYKHYTVAI